VNPFIKKSTIFFADFMSPDSNLHNKAARNVDYVKLDSTDLPQLKMRLPGLTGKKINI